MNEDFNDLPWHDANIVSIYIDRQRPGVEDVIKLTIEWPNEGNLSTIEFTDCYALSANMNFGIIASESILSAECISHSDELISIRNRWSSVGVNLEMLRCFKIITNSTNSTFSIFALGYKQISPLKNP